jgi:hypothetical protein
MLTLDELPCHVCKASEAVDVRHAIAQGGLDESNRTPYLAADENASGGVCNSARSSAGPVWRLKLSALLIRPT